MANNVHQSPTSSQTQAFESVLASYLPRVNNILEKYLPRHFTKDSLEKFTGKATYTLDTASATKSLLEPIWDILDRGGKRWRPVLVLLVAESLGGKIDLVEPCAYFCELIHNGTLVVDDIEDNSELRRGQPCIHRKYGVDVAINAGNGMYFFPLLVLRELREQKGVPLETLVRSHELYEQEMINLHVGQALDIWWHAGHKDPTEDEYLQMCAFKTGTLARLSAKISALFSGATDEQIMAIGKFAEAIGVAFQIQDDLLNLIGERFSQKISIQGEDIYEGKRTLMVIHCLAHAKPEDAKRLTEILNMHTRDPTLIQEAIAIMRRTNSLDYAAQRARQIVQDAWSLVAGSFPENEAKQKLRLFAHYLIERNF
jgi:geranylgeranyl pyrophosphate synthase